MTIDPARLLIVIPCLNEQAHLPALLGQLRRDNPGSRIVVADGGSRDRSRAIVTERAAQDMLLTLMDNPARIQSAGINRAVVLHSGGCDWLLRIDAHCDYPDGYGAGLLAAAEAQDATSVVVPMATVGIAGFQRAVAAAQNSVIGTGGSPHRHVGEGRFVDHGHHALMRIDLFRAVGGYREDMPHNEDAELDIRLAAAGGRIWLEPGQAITYYPRRDPLSLWRQYRGYGRGRARTLALHRKRPKLRQMLPLAVAGAAALALLTPLWWPFALPLIAWALLVLGLGLIVGVRAGGGAALAAGVAAMIMHLAWSIGFLQGALTGARKEKSPNR
jgi:succinoglycan biosynthesis protein ExoA